MPSPPSLGLQTVNLIQICGGCIDAFVAKISTPPAPPATPIITYADDMLLRPSSAVEAPGDA